jgi:hypothetical protein
VRTATSHTVQIAHARRYHSPLRHNACTDIGDRAIDVYIAVPKVYLNVSAECCGGGDVITMHAHTQHHRMRMVFSGWPSKRETPKAEGRGEGGSCVQSRREEVRD